MENGEQRGTLQLDKMAQEPARLVNLIQILSIAMSAEANQDTVRRFYEADTPGLSGRLTQSD